MTLATITSGLGLIIQLYTLEKIISGEKKVHQIDIKDLIKELNEYKEVFLFNDVVQDKILRSMFRGEFGISNFSHSKNLTVPENGQRIYVITPNKGEIIILTDVKIYTDPNVIKYRFIVDNSFEFESKISENEILQGFSFPVPPCIKEEIKVILENSASENVSVSISHYGFKMSKIKYLEIEGKIKKVMGYV